MKNMNIAINVMKSAAATAAKADMFEIRSRISGVRVRRVQFALYGRIGDEYIGTDKWRAIACATVEIPAGADFYAFADEVIPRVEALFERATGIDSWEYIPNLSW